MGNGEFKDDYESVYRNVQFFVSQWLLKDFYAMYNYIKKESIRNFPKTNILELLDFVIIRNFHSTPQ